MRVLTSFAVFGLANTNQIKVNSVNIDVYSPLSVSSLMQEGFRQCLE